MGLLEQEYNRGVILVSFLTDKRIRLCQRGVGLQVDNARPASAGVLGSGKIDAGDGLQQWGFARRLGTAQALWLISTASLKTIKWMSTLCIHHWPTMIQSHSRIHYFCSNLPEKNQSKQNKQAKIIEYQNGLIGFLESLRWNRMQACWVYFGGTHTLHTHWITGRVSAWLVDSQRQPLLELGSFLDSRGKQKKNSLQQQLCYVRGIIEEEKMCGTELLAFENEHWSQKQTAWPSSIFFFLEITSFVWGNRL